MNVSGKRRPADDSRKDKYHQNDLYCPDYRVRRYPGNCPNRKCQGSYESSPSGSDNEVPVSLRCSVGKLRRTYHAHATLTCTDQSRRFSATHLTDRVTNLPIAIWTSGRKSSEPYNYRATFETSRTS